MECPYCKNEMRKGFVQSAREIFFSERERVLFYRSHPKLEKDIRIANLWNEYAAPAHYCDACQCLIVKKDEEKE